MEMKSAVTGGDGCNFSPRAGGSLLDSDLFPFYAPQYMEQSADKSLSWNTFWRRLITYLSDSDKHRPAPLCRLCDFGAIYKYRDLLTSLSQNRAQQNTSIMPSVYNVD